MANNNWLERIGWSNNEIEDIRLIAYLYVKQGQYKTALILFEGLLLLKPENVYDLQSIGGIHLQMKNPLLALQYFDRALKVNPDHELTKLNRMKALLALGYRKQAYRASQDLLQSPNKEYAQTAEALLLSYQVQQAI